MVNMVYYLLPDSELLNIHSLALFLKSPAGMKLEFIRGITLSMEVPISELKNVSIFF